LCAQPAYAYWNNKNASDDTYYGMVKCCKNAFVFTELLRSEEIQTGSIIWYVNKHNDSKEEEWMMKDAVGLLKAQGLGEKTVLLTNKDWMLTLKEDCNIIYLEGGDADAFWYIMDGDTVSIDLQKKELYLYVADLELLFRKYDKTTTP